MLRMKLICWYMYIVVVLLCGFDVCNRKMEYFVVYVFKFLNIILKKRDYIEKGIIKIK